MTTAELIELLERIHRERMFETHHDMLFQSYPDIEALDAVINLLKFLGDKNSSDTLKVSDLLNRLKA